MRITPRPGTLAVTVGLALLTAACGATSSSSTSSSTSAGGTSSTGNGGTTSTYVADMLGLARCLRAHGIPNYPDPNASGQEPPDTKTLLSTPQGQAAVGACSSWSSRVHGDTDAENQGTMAGYVRFAQCMRAHGLPNFPDPSDTQGRVVFLVNSSQDGFDPHSPQVIAKAHACESVLPAGSGLPHLEATS